MSIKNYPTGEVTMPISSILDVAQYILEKGKLDTLPYTKLERLCYYAQAWSLAWDDEPIFPEAFYAGAHSAVCPEFFQSVNNRLYIAVTENIGVSEILSDDQKASVDAIIEYYYDYSTERLGQLIRAEFPWYDARCLLEANKNATGRITHENMKNYYKTLLD